MKGTAALLLLSALAVVACGDTSDPVVATIDGEPVQYRQFERWVEENVGQTSDGLEEVALSALFGEMLDELCLIRMAEDSGFSSVQDGPRESVARMVAALDESQAQTEAGNQAVEGTESRSVGQILVLSKETAEAVRTDILTGGDPEEVALRWQERGVGVLFGGVQHGVHRSDLPPAFAQEVFALEPGGVSEVLEAEYGSHLFFLPRRSVARSQTVQESLLATMAHRARGRYNVVLIEANLPFRLTTEDSENAAHD